jgi:hypothetical protein
MRKIHHGLYVYRLVVTTKICDRDFRWHEVCPSCILASCEAKKSSKFCSIEKFWRDQSEAVPHSNVDEVVDFRTDEGMAAAVPTGTGGFMRTAA